MTGVMLVTGGSRGIGAAICRRAAQAGWDVAVNYHGAADKAAGVVAEVEALGRRAIAVQADTADETAVAEMAKVVAERAKVGVASRSRRNRSPHLLAHRSSRARSGQARRIHRKRREPWCYRMRCRSPT